ncbi:uncharacterized protein TEOVI_000081000 [Trypanosoma equiperdum]|uniref:Variant surface glycoprotein n=1 Tax=Trypanosoma equiperdum TaxID=5694 RepID=A0A1G4IAW9_TRYEQ|nr:hypothetical protein TEOVI_000081000 [Trypanosoma equiperdum]
MSLPFLTGSDCQKPAEEDSKEPAINRTRLVHYLCKNRKEMPKTQKSIKSETVGSLTIDPVARQVALLALGENKKDNDSEQGKNAAKLLLGTDESKTIDKFSSALETDDLQLSQEKGESKTSIKAAAESDDYGLALAYFSGLALKRSKQTAKSVTATVQAKEDDCAGKKGTECKGKCELDGEIFKPKKKGKG